MNPAQKDVFVPNFVHIRPAIAWEYWRQKKKEKLELKCGAFQITGRRMDYGLYFRRNDTVDFVGDGTVEKPTTETIGVDTEIMFPSCGRAEIYGSKTSQKNSL